MEAHKRQIKKFHLRTNDESIIYRSVALLEDAFNIATLPGIPPNGSVFIRRLNLGRITNISSSAAISRCIDDKVRLIASSAVRVDVEDRPRADVVWFKDSLQPYIALASLIAEGKTPGAWYWKKAVPSWNPVTTSYQSILSLLKGGVTTPSQALAPALIIDKLIQLHREEIFLNSLTLHDATTLLNLTGVYPHEVPYKVTATSQRLPTISMETIWQKSIGRWIQQWGPQDNRSLWMSYNALLLHNPAYVNNAHIVEASLQLAETVHKKLMECARPQEERYSTPPEFNMSELINKKRVAENQEINKHNTRLGQDDSKKIQALRDAQHTHSPESDRLLRSEGSVIEQGRSKNHTKPNIGHTTSFAELKTIQHHFIEDINHEGVQHAYKNEINEQTNGHIWSQTQEQTSYDDQPKSQSTNQGVFAFTLNAGFSFVIGLLERLGIQDVLKAGSHFTEINLAAQILWAVVHRLNIPADDPACSFVSKAPRIGQEAEFEFVAPQQWTALLNDKIKNRESKLLRLITVNGNKHILTDKSGEIVLAIWSHQQPEEVSKWVQTHEIIPGSITPISDLDHIKISFLLMMECYLKQYANMNMRTLVKREGMVATTNTHVDVLFDPKYADVGIRKAGLDINPGWVPWLGKVIQYHYQEKGINHV